MSRRLAKCPVCGDLTGVKGFSIVIFLLLCLLGGFPAIIYLLFRVFGKKKCSKCGSSF